MILSGASPVYVDMLPRCFIFVCLFGGGVCLFVCLFVVVFSHAESFYGSDHFLLYTPSAFSCWMLTLLTGITGSRSEAFAPASRFLAAQGGVR